MFTLVLPRIYPAFANSVGPDQLASEDTERHYDIIYFNIFHRKKNIEMAQTIPMKCQDLFSMKIKTQTNN